MKKPAPVSPDTVPSEALPLPQTGGSYIRLPDGNLRREEATDNSPETRLAAVEEGVQSPVPNPVTEA